jgi:SAM-dependent methyltransferase
MIRRILRIFKKPVDIRSLWIYEPAKFQSLVDFLNWFDAASSVEETLNRAYGDWDERLTRFSGFSTLDKQICLEIGFGGGRLLVPASRVFKKVIGVDIHCAFDKTDEFLQSQKVENYSLIDRDELKSVKADSVDFVYSFIVFQHFNSFEEVNFYLSDVKRILSVNGYCHIFFGKCSGAGVKVTHPKHFKKRACSLFIEPSLFRQHLSQMGFHILEHEDKMPKRLDEPLSASNESGQARVLFRK